MAERWKKKQPHVVRATCVGGAYFDILYWELTHSTDVLISSEAAVSSDIITLHFVKAPPLHLATQTSKCPAIHVHYSSRFMPVSSEDRVSTKSAQESALERLMDPVMVEMCFMCMYYNSEYFFKKNRNSLIP